MYHRVLKKYCKQLITVLLFAVLLGNTAVYVLVDTIFLQPAHLTELTTSLSALTKMNSTAPLYRCLLKGYLYP